jgi:hypothetical protein
MSDLLIQIIGTDLSPDEMPTGPCVILTGDERAVAEAAHMWGRRVKLVTGDAAERIAELEAEIVDQKRMRQEEKDKILRQRAEIVSLLKENRRHLSMARGLQKRVAALETAQAEMVRREETRDE